MLVLARKPEQKIIISGPAVVKVVRVDKFGGQYTVRLGFEAPDTTQIIRAELIEKR